MLIWKKYHLGNHDQDGQGVTMILTKKQDSSFYPVTTKGVIRPYPTDFFKLPALALCTNVTGAFQNVAGWRRHQPGRAAVGQSPPPTFNAAMRQFGMRRPYALT